MSKCIRNKPIKIYFLLKVILIYFLRSKIKNILLLNKIPTHLQNLYRELNFLKMPKKKIEKMYINSKEFKYSLLFLNIKH